LINLAQLERCGVATIADAKEKLCFAFHVRSSTAPGGGRPPHTATP
jgi:hypothetical protein